MTTPTLVFLMMHSNRNLTILLDTSLPMITILGKDQHPCRSVRRKMKPILDRLFNEGLESDDTKNRVVIHTLRHTFASQLAIKGIPLIKIKKLMNHAKIEMSERYAKLAPDSGRDVIEGLYDTQ